MPRKGKKKRWHLIIETLDVTGNVEAEEMDVLCVLESRWKGNKESVDELYRSRSQQPLWRGKCKC